VALSFLYRRCAAWPNCFGSIGYAAANDAEISVLRHQPAALSRQVARPRFSGQTGRSWPPWAKLVPRERWA
jgi:hypothetical protein